MLHHWCNCDVIICLIYVMDKKVFLDFLFVICFFVDSSTPVWLFGFIFENKFYLLFNINIFYV